MKLKTIFALLGLLVVGVATAELEHSNKSILVPTKAPVVKNVNSNLSSANLKDLQLDKSKLLRCWQYGQLIIAENGWQNPSPEGKTILRKGGERMIGFDYGETFCLYMGN